MPLLFQVLDLSPLHLIHFGQSLYFLLMPFDLRIQIIDLLSKVRFSVAGLLYDVVLENLAIF